MLAADVVAVVRNPSKAADLAERGVSVREGDYNRPETLPGALAGVARLLLVSGSEVGQRVPQHTAVIEAAKAAGVQRIAYTSLLRADSTTLPVAPEHVATEQALRESGLSFALLRNGWYTENYTDQIDQYLATGEIVGATGEGRVSAATRADYAAAAAAVLLADDADDADDAVHQLGEPAFTFDDLAAAVTEITGTPVAHRDVSVDQLVAGLQGVGLAEGTAGFVAAIDVSIADGALYTDSDDLARLLGRPGTPLIEAVRAARGV